jgi:hypothetical protein
MTTFTTIDLDLLAAVNGGTCQCMAPQAPAGGAPGAAAPPTGAAPASSPAPSAGAAPGGGGGFISFIRGILGFLQSPQFTHGVNGASELLAAFAPQDSGAQDSGTAQA